MGIKQTLLEEIETFCDRVTMSRTTFGINAMKDGSFIPRMEKEDAVVTSETIDKVRAYIDGATAEVS